MAMLRRKNKRVHREKAARESRRYAKRISGAITHLFDGYVMSPNFPIPLDGANG